VSPLELADALQLFSEPEVLSEEDQWYCPDCAAHVRATKLMQLWSAPTVLVLHLKVRTHPLRADTLTAGAAPQVETTRLTRPGCRATRTNGH
jgi:ubiquitin C-terminal hydrolase